MILLDFVRFSWIFNVSLSPCRLQNKANRTRFRPHNADRNAHRGCKNSGIYNRFAFAIKTLCLLVPGGHTRVWHSNLSASLRESWPPPPLPPFRGAVSYTHPRAHGTRQDRVGRLRLEKKKQEKRRKKTEVSRESTVTYRNSKSGNKLHTADTDSCSITI